MEKIVAAPRQMAFSVYVISIISFNYILRALTCTEWDRFDFDVSNGCVRLQEEGEKGTGLSILRH